MKKALTTLVLVALMIVSATAQKDKKKINPAIDADALQLEFVQPQNTNRLHDIARMLEKLHGRQIQVIDDTGNMRFVRNLSTYGGAIVIHETEGYVEKIKKTIARLDFPLQEEVALPKSSQYVTLEYKPKFISVFDARDALNPFKRSINLALPHEAQQLTSNMTIAGNAGIVVMRDEKIHVERMMQVLTKIDKPRAQFMISCMLIQGTSEPADDRAAKMLPSELKSMSPYKNFKIVSSGVLRVSERSVQRVNLSMNGADGVQTQLTFQPTIFDTKTGALGLENVNVEYISLTKTGKRVGQSFSTSTTIKYGEHVVIGAFGDNPVFAVLKLVQL